MNVKSRKKHKRYRLLLFSLVMLFAVVFCFSLLNSGKYGDKGSEYDVIIEKYAAINELDPDLVRAVISVESNFNSKAVSGKKAKGLMQMTDETEAWCAWKNNLDSNPSKLFDPEYNISMGCYYLSYLVDSFVSYEVALAAYNAGPGNVKNWLNNPEYSVDGKTLHNIPFPETEAYVRNVMHRYEIYKQRNK